jgi:hypothetical protein
MSIFNDKALKGVAAAVAKIMDEELKGNQHKIDANKNGKVDAHDFKLLRGKKTMKEDEQLDEYESKSGVYKNKGSYGTSHNTDDEDDEKKTKGYGARQNANQRGKSVGAKLSKNYDEKDKDTGVKQSPGRITKTKTGLIHKMREEYDPNKSISDEQYHNHETNYPLHHVTGEKDGTMHSHSLKYLHDAHQHHSFARDVEEPSEGGGQNGPAAKAVHDIEKHVSHKYGKEAGGHIANSHEKGNYKKVQTAAKQHMATMKESKLSFTEMLELYNESGIEVINKIFPQTVKFGDTEVELIDANIVNGVVGITVAEEVDNETFTKELNAQKAKNAGGGKKAEVAKPSVQAVKQEEVEQIDELSKDTLSMYVKKAHYSGGMADFKHGRIADKRGDSKDKMKLSKISRNRERGINKAVDRLTKKD